MWKCVLCSITLLVLSVCGEITVNNNAYKGIVVAIGDDLVEADCNNTFNLIKEMLTSASELLYNATDNRLSFGEVTVVVPNSWTCEDSVDPPAGIRLSDAHVRVGPSHPVFGDNPWTQQPKGCGEQGDFIYISEGYLKSPSEIYGTTAQVFVQEWAKFRWGVFEESGHLGDALFPPSYQTILNDTLTMLPNYCTNKEILGDQSCTSDTAEQDCLFSPSTNGSNDGITSSLLSVPFLKNVVHFCNNSTHKDNIPSKHNFLCYGKSSWDVIKDNTDISETISSKNIPAEPTIKLLRAASPFSEKIVIAMEYSQKTGLIYDTWEFLRDTVEQFIEVKINPEAKVGLIKFSNTAEILANLTVLSSSEKRTDLSAKVPKARNETDATKNLAEAISLAASCLNNDGVIILMTANQENTPEAAKDLISAAGGNSVWPILFPHKGGTDVSVYETLAKDTSGQSYTITSTGHENAISFGEFQDVNNYHDMSLKMLQIQTNISSRAALVEIDTHDCAVLAPQCNVAFEINEPLLYEDEYIIEIYSASGDYPISNIENADFEIIAELDTYKAYKIQKDTSNSFSMTINRKFKGDIMKVTLMATKLQESSDYSVIVSASPSVENLLYTSDTAPVIYVQVAKNWDLVVFATVVAKVESNNISLYDNGMGADVTGNDGIYSAYLLGVSNTGKADISFYVDDNNGNAKIMQVQNKTVPSNANGTWCCGSNIDLSDVQLVPAVNLSVISTVISGTVTGDPGQDLPPGRVTDLTATAEGITVDSKQAQITLNFAATGDVLDQGIVSYYKVISDPNDDPNRTCGNQTAESGTNIICSFSISIPESGTLYTYYLVAVNGKSIEGKHSNKARIFVSAETIVVPETRTTLTGGAIAGIVIGVLLFIILVVLGVLLFLGKDEKDDSIAWNIVSCKCCKREEEDNIYNKDPPTSARSNDVTRNPTVEPIRSIEDLYAKPDMDAKKRNQTEKNKDDHDDEDGGFPTHRSRSNDIPLQSNHSVNNTLERGSQQNLPINQVGIPIAENPSLTRNQRGTHQSYDRNTYNQRNNPNQDYRGVNNGYDASNDYGTNNYSQPQTGRAPRTLTQV